MIQGPDGKPHSGAELTDASTIMAAANIDMQAFYPAIKPPTQQET
jgi:hypothetical protein